MASEIIGVVGPPGSGKSTSIRNLNPTETFIVNVANKPLPLRGYKKNYTPFNDNKEVGNIVNTSNPETIVKILKFVSAKRPEIKQIVIDDSGYIMSFSNMDKASTKGFDE